MQYFIRFFWQLGKGKVTKGYFVISVFLGQSGICIFKSVQFIRLFISLDFISSPLGFVVSPVENIFLYLVPENF